MTNAHGLFVLANCYTLAGLTSIFPGGSGHSDWEFIMWAYEGRVYPWVLNVGIYTGPVCEESGALVTQLSEPPILGLS